MRDRRSRKRESDDGDLTCTDTPEWNASVDATVGTGLAGAGANSN